MPSNRMHRSLVWTAAAARLEQRITPALPIVGPWPSAHQATAARLGATAWTALAAAPAASPAQVPFTSLASFTPLTLDLSQFTARLADAPAESAVRNLRFSPVQVALPSPDGSFHRFAVAEVSIVEPGLSEKFPDIKTYRGQGIDDPAANLAVDVTAHGFRASVLTPNGSWYVDPYFHLDQSLYAAYYRRDVTARHEFICYTGTTGSGCGCESCASAALTATARETDSVIVTGGPDPGGFGGGGGGHSGGGSGDPTFAASGETLRTYRTAIAATGEYTTFHGGTVAAGLSAIVTSLNRLNQVFERDLAVRMILVAENNQLVFTNAATDPYSNGNAFKMLAQNQNTLDSVIGAANYDHGHVYGTGGGGVAGDIGTVGRPGLKGQGVSLSSPPVNDPFVIDYVAHEMGHQFGGRHTFSSCGGGPGDASIYAFEPGSGTSIMAYAGICNGNENTQANSDAMFHSGSLDLINDYITNSAFGQGHTQTPTGNNAPFVDAGPDYVIPASTPFFLTAAAADPDGDPLTYSWEQRNPGAGNAANPSNTSNGPLFRTFLPSDSPVRYFPRLNNVLNGTVSVGETLPTVSRSMTFRAVVRDNRAGGGAVNFDEMKVTVVKTSGPFAVTSPNTAITWVGGNAQTVTWNVAGTDANGINAKAVDILLSLDGGQTWDTLAVNTPNDGSQAVNIPNTPTTSARIKVQASDNIFYDVSDKNFTIKAGSGMAVESTFPVSGTEVNSPVESFDVRFTLPVNPVTVGNNDLTLSKGTVTKAEVIAPDTVRYGLANVIGTGPWEVTMSAGAVSSTGGLSVGSAVFEFILEPGFAAFPVPLLPVAPLGSLVYSGSTVDVISSSTDTDSFTIELEAGQTAVARVVPATTLRPTLAITGPGNVSKSGQADAPGQAFTLPPVTIAQAGTYTLTVGGVGGMTGKFTLELELNAGRETEPNDTPATAQSLTPFAYNLGGGAFRYAVRGRTDPSSNLLPNEIEPNNGTSLANDASKNFLPYTGNLYQLGVIANITNDDVDLYDIGAMQVGDVLTVSMSGSRSNRGTLIDPLVALVRANNGNPLVVVVNDEGGPGPNDNSGDDALIYRFSVNTPDTYYILAQAFDKTQAGTYQLAAWLENAGPPPATGGGSVVETEPNNSVATANDFATSWRPVQYQSVTAGTIATQNDVDFFRFQFNTGDRVTFVASPVGGGLDARINLRNSAGTVIALEDGSSDGPGQASPIYGFRIPSTGVYFLEVQSLSGTGKYVLTGSLSASSPPPRGDVPPDYFAVQLTAGQTFEAGLNWTGGSPLELAITDSSGIELAGGVAKGGYGAIASYVVPGDGKYFVRVGGSPNTEYVLVATSGAALEREPNNSFAAAQPLGTAGRVLGARGDDDDWYRFEVKAGQSIELSTATPGDGVGEFRNDLDPILDLYGPSGVLIAGDDNSGPDGRNAQLKFNATAGGNYVVRVRAAGLTSGEYVLTQVLGKVVDPPPTVTAVTVNDGTAQRSRVTSLTVTFSEPVTLPADAATAFRLNRIGIGGPSPDIGLSASGAGASVTLQFAGALTEFGSLIDGDFALTVIGSKVTDSIGQTLAGGDFSTSLFRLFGDINGSRTVDFTDFLAFRTTFGLKTGAPGFNAAFDFDANGEVNFSDFLQFRTRFGSQLP